MGEMGLDYYYDNSPRDVQQRVFRRQLEQARAANTQRDFALRQLSRAEAINDLNAFLLSDAAAIIRGQSINVDGGDTPY